MHRLRALATRVISRCCTINQLPMCFDTFARRRECEGRAQQFRASSTHTTGAWNRADYFFLTFFKRLLKEIVDAVTIRPFTPRNCMFACAGQCSPHRAVESAGPIRLVVLAACSWRLYQRRRIRRRQPLRDLRLRFATSLCGKHPKTQAVGDFTFKFYIVYASYAASCGTHSDGNPSGKGGLRP